MTSDYAENDMNDKDEKRTRVLDPIHRISEIAFGALMALTFTGTLSVATANHEEVRSMLYAALGCNLAWGLADAVIFLISTVTERHRGDTLLRRLQQTSDPRAGQQQIADVLPERLAAVATPEALETLRLSLLKIFADDALETGAARFGLRRLRVRAGGAGDLSDRDSVYVYSRSGAGAARL